LLEPDHSKSPSRTTLEAKVNLSAAGSMLSSVFETAASRIDDVISKKNNDLTLDHTAMGMSINTAPLASELDLWTVFDEVSTDPFIKKSPEYKPIEFAQLGEFPQLRKRFLDWVAVTELLADAEAFEDTGLSNSGSIMPQQEGVVKIFDSLESSPRFTSVQKLRDFVWRIRGIKNSDIAQVIQQ